MLFKTSFYISRTVHLYRVVPSVSFYWSPHAFSNSSRIVMDFLSLNLYLCWCSTLHRDGISWHNPTRGVVAQTIKPQTPSAPSHTYRTNETLSCLASLPSPFLGACQWLIVLTFARSIGMTIMDSDWTIWTITNIKLIYRMPTLTHFLLHRFTFFLRGRFNLKRLHPQRISVKLYFERFG